MAIEILPPLAQVATIMDFSMWMMFGCFYGPSFLMVFQLMASIATNNGVATDRRSIARRAGIIGKAWVSMKITFMSSMIAIYTFSFIWMSYFHFHDPVDKVLTKMYQFRVHPESQYQVSTFQMNMKCCGAKSYDDWFDIQ